MHNLSHTQKISVASITFLWSHYFGLHRHLARKTREKDINFSVCIQTIGDEIERERERERNFKLTCGRLLWWHQISTSNFPKPLCHCIRRPSVQWLLDKHHKKKCTLYIHTYIHTYGHITQIKVVSSSQLLCSLLANLTLKLSGKSPSLSPPVLSPLLSPLIPSSFQWYIHKSKEILLNLSMKLSI